MDPSNPDLGSAIQPGDVLKLRLQAIGRMKEILLLSNPEHACGKDQQGRNNEDS
jgi:hypothetical protein